MMKSAVVQLLQAAWIASLLGCAAGVVVHNESANGFSCSVLVRGSMPVEEGSAFADQGPFVNNTLYLWKDWVNEEMGGLTVRVGEDGELRQCGIDLVIEEDHSDVELVAEIMEKYVDEADFLIAPYGSTLTIPAIPITESHEKLLLAGGASATSLFKDTNFMFGMVTPTDRLFRLILRALSLRGMKTVAYISEDTPYTMGVCSAIPDLIAELNVEQVGFEVVSPDASDEELDQALKNLKDMNVDAIFGCTYYDICRRTLLEAEKLKLEPKAWVFTICISQPGFIDDVGYLANYIVGASQWEPTLDLTCEVTGWTPAEYSQRYQARFGVEPTMASATYMGGVLAWTYVVNKWHSTASYDVAMQMSKLNLETVCCTVGFDSNSMFKGDPVFMQHINYTKHIVQPESLADAPMIYPMPSWTVQQCVQEFGEHDCRCSPDGCRACMRDDYTYTVGDCDTSGMRSVYFYLPPFICSPEKGVDLPDSIRVGCDYLPADSVQGGIIMALTVAGVVVIAGSAVSVYFHRKNKFVMAAQPLFLLLFLAGAVLVLVGNTMPMDEVSAAQCQSFCWIIFIGMDIMFGSVNVKLYRIWRIFGNRRLLRIKVTESDMLRLIGGIVLLDCVLVGGWTLFWDPLTTKMVTEDYDVELKQEVCHIQDVPILWASISIKGFMVVTACFFSHQTRNVDKKFLQSNLITYALYQMFLMGLLGVCVYAIMDDEIDRLFVRMLVISLSTFGAVLFIVVCRLFAVYRQAAEEPGGQRSHSGGGAGSHPPNKSRNNTNNSSAEEDSGTGNFAELLFSPASLMEMTNHLNELEDENKALKVQLKQLREYFETGVVGDEVAHLFPRPTKSSFFRPSAIGRPTELAQAPPNK